MVRGNFKGALGVADRPENGRACLIEDFDNIHRVEIVVLYDEISTTGE
ncbi:hypothetical protein JNB91_26360 [Rhizobium wenxiniae]|nr:hypothetical protein [Rhizobium wenxiniae]MBW9091338.1 hypothetical protein [Rhizobium wenxiniae]